MEDATIVWFKDLGMGDVERVGGKNASLGEMISNLAGAGVSVPDGFATTADAYREFLKHEGLDDRINAFDDPVQARKDFIARQPLGRLGTAEEIAAMAVFSVLSH